MTFRSFLSCNTVYKPTDIYDVLGKIKPGFKKVKTSNKVTYINSPCAFDIETSSFYDDMVTPPDKVAIMYEWSLGLNGLVIIGRTWKEFKTVYDVLVDDLGLNDTNRLIIYVHNLAFEFQFLRFRFKWFKVFSLETRKPIYAITNEGVEFRCSYLLSGYALKSLDSQLTRYKVHKLVGNLDYTKVRHQHTLLSTDEIAYCVCDVKVVMAYIQELIENDGGIDRIPITKTGYVRNYCRNMCFYEGGIRKKKSYQKLRYMELMKSLKLTPLEYDQLQRAFQGGFTHANPFMSGKTLHDVTSYDFTSSYPTVMIAEKFPMSSAEKVKIESKEDFERNIKLYCCLFDVEIYGLESKVYYDSYLSESRCRYVLNPVINNGRIVSADHLVTTLTEQDYMIMCAFYKWEKFKVGNFRRYKKGYLPTDFIKAILKLYKDKTTLKGVEGREVDYLLSKGMLNSCYGMAVTDIVRPEYGYSDDWDEPIDPYKPKAIMDYNDSKSRFLFYPWGVWVTAYSRRNLFTGICEFKEDYVYSDTDSIKVLNASKHADYITRYNYSIRLKLIKALQWHGIPGDEIEPLGKCMGVWDFDGHYEKFKTLGAKRYLVKYSHDDRNPKDKHGTYSLTVAGLNKHVCLPYLIGLYGEAKLFDQFKQDLYIPGEYTGKNTHTYIDERKTGIVTDYLGHSCVYDEMSGVHLEAAEYSLSISKEYEDYILDKQTDVI